MRPGIKLPCAIWDCARMLSYRECKAPQPMSDPAMTFKTCLLASMAAALSACAGDQSNNSEYRVGGTILHAESTIDDVPERFQFSQPGAVQWKQTAERRLENYGTFRVTFPSPVTTASTANNTVHCEYYFPKTVPAGERCPATVVLHILGGDFELSRLCCRTLASTGVAALFVKMPYYGPRRSPGSDERMISADPEKTVARMTQAVKDIRRAADWLCAREEVDSSRLGITGISLGGITAALAASVEPRFKKSCFALAGGDFATLFMTSSELAAEREAWKDQNITAEQVGEALRPIDPLTYAKRLRGREVLMFNGTRDTVIPRSCTEKLWTAAGKPELVWWNASHFSAAFYLPSAMVRMTEFFRSQSQHPR